MIDPEKFREMFDGQASAALLRTHLAALDAYERMLQSGSMEGGSLSAVMNDVLKAAMDAQLTLLKSSGNLGENVRGLQQEWLAAYRRYLETAIAEQESRSGK